MKKEIKFLYTIQQPCNGLMWFTCDPSVAEEASRNGCIVTCKGVSLENGKAYKHK